MLILLRVTLTTSSPGLSERLNHILTAFYLSGMVKCIYTSRDALSKRLFRFRQVIGSVSVLRFSGAFGSCSP